MENSSADKTTFTRLMHIGMVVKDMNKTIERLASMGIGPFQPRILPPGARETYRKKPFDPRSKTESSL